MENDEALLRLDPESKPQLDDYSLEAMRRRRRHQVTFGNVQELGTDPVEASVGVGTGWCATSP